MIPLNFFVIGLPSVPIIVTVKTSFSINLIFHTNTVHAKSMNVSMINAYKNSYGRSKLVISTSTTPIKNKEWFARDILSLILAR